MGQRETPGRRDDGDAGRRESRQPRELAQPPGCVGLDIAAEEHLFCDGHIEELVEEPGSPALPFRDYRSQRYRQIQQALIDKGYLQGSASGAWGQDSVAALRQFQADQKLDGSGKINALTLIRLGLGPKRDPAVQNGRLPEAAPKTEP